MSRNRLDSDDSCDLMNRECVPCYNILQKGSPTFEICINHYTVPVTFPQSMMHSLGFYVFAIMALWIGLPLGLPYALENVDSIKSPAIKVNYSTDFCPLS